jgi:hypothetical protein
MTAPVPLRRVPLRLLLVVALLCGVLTAVLGSDDAHADEHGATHSAMTAAQLVLHDQMRKLWEDHVTWTRLAIVEFAAADPGFSATAHRLFANQVDIGDAIKPYFGDAPGDELTSLLHDHIAIAVEVMQAAKDGDTVAFNEANARWYANADAIADFLSAANPRYGPDATMRQDMKVHLDQTLAEAADELHGD